MVATSISSEIRIESTTFPENKNWTRKGVEKFAVNYFWTNFHSNKTKCNQSQIVRMFNIEYPVFYSPKVKFFLLNRPKIWYASASFSLAWYQKKA